MIWVFAYIDWIQIFSFQAEAVFIHTWGPPSVEKAVGPATTSLASEAASFPSGKALKRTPESEKWDPVGAQPRKLKSSER